ncbi:hypothetical protein SscP1EGY_47 [Streptomyces phage SscP1EGY]|nr:hypothetical protein SscP1EGY_47 [Streptomyces phage SscP1EGY]
MDQTFETPVVDETSENTDPSFAKEIAKSVVLSTAISAGVVTGMIAVGMAMNKIEQLKARRAEKKAAALKDSENKEN